MTGVSSAGESLTQHLRRVEAAISGVLKAKKHSRGQLVQHPHKVDAAAHSS